MINSGNTSQKKGEESVGMRRSYLFDFNDFRFPILHRFSSFIFIPTCVEHTLLLLFSCVINAALLLFLQFSGAFPPHIPPVCFSSFTSSSHFLFPLLSLASAGQLLTSWWCFTSCENWSQWRAIVGRFLSINANLDGLSVSHWTTQRKMVWDDFPLWTEENQPSLNKFSFLFLLLRKNSHRCEFGFQGIPPLSLLSLPSFKLFVTCSCLDSSFVEISKASVYVLSRSYNLTSNVASG
jgi:hypothetical protein